MTSPEAQLQQVRIDRIVPHPENPRRHLGDLTEMVASIKSLGVLQALVLHEENDGTMTCLIGHRRHAASDLAGKETVPAFVWSSLSLTAQIEIMLTENMQRRNLTPMEEARSFNSLERAGRSQREIAQRIGCNQSHVSRRLQLLKLSPADQELVETGKLSPAKALRALDPPEEKAPKAPKPEKVEPPAGMSPDPIDVMEPIGYKVIELNSDGEYVDNWSAEIFASPDGVRAEVANTTVEGDMSLIPVALVLLAPVETIKAPVSADEPSPSDEVGSVAGGEEEGPAVPVSEQVEADAGPLATEDLSDERKEALVHFAKTWAVIPAADEQTVRESAEHEFGDEPGDAERAVRLWNTAREELSARGAA